MKSSILSKKKNLFNSQKFNTDYTNNLAHLNGVVICYIGMTIVKLLNSYGLFNNYNWYNFQKVDATSGNGLIILENENQPYSS